MLAAIVARPSLADKSGVSFWRPGAYDSLSATPNPPGWSLSTTSYRGAGLCRNQHFRGAFVPRWPDRQDRGALVGSRHVGTGPLTNRPERA